jgi:lipopolysaccharide transport system permease protein
MAKVKIQPGTSEVSANIFRALNLYELWQYRHLAGLLAWRNFRVRYKQTLIGIAWGVITPISYTLIFMTLFSLMSVKAVGSLPYVPAVFASMIVWQFFSRGLMDAGTSLTANSNLITKVYFPRLLLPVSSVISGFPDLIISLFLLIFLFYWYDVIPTVRILALPAFILLAAMITLSFSFWLAALDGLYRDIRHALPLLLQLGMFISPVAYTTLDNVPEKWRWLYDLNPMVACLEGVRWALFPMASSPSLMMLMQSLAVTLVIFISGLIFFAKIEINIADRV